jgi:protein-S-isoprenylcysteine O-methyltransferase Ste14
MTASTSTPRLRFTYAIYALLVPATLFTGPAAVTPALDCAAGIAGFLLVASACLGRIWCSAFIAGHKDARLVTAGPYSRARHPLYAFSMLGALGLACASRSPVAGLFVVIAVSALVTHAATAEDRFLASAHPEAFAAWIAATPNRFWPGPSGLIPQVLELAPKVFRKAFLDAGAFFLLFLLVELAARARLSGAFWNLAALRVI